MNKYRYKQTMFRQANISFPDTSTFCRDPVLRYLTTLINRLFSEVVTEN